MPHLFVERIHFVGYIFTCGKIGKIQFLGGKNRSFGGIPDSVFWEKFSFLGDVKKKSALQIGLKFGTSII